MTEASIDEEKLQHSQVGIPPWTFSPFLRWWRSNFLSRSGGNCRRGSFSCHSGSFYSSCTGRNIQISEATLLFVLHSSFGLMKGFFLRVEFTLLSRVLERKGRVDGEVEAEVLAMTGHWPLANVWQKASRLWDTKEESTASVAHRCTIFLCLTPGLWNIDDQHN